MITKKLTIAIGFFSIILLTSFIEDPDFYALPKIKTIVEWEEWASTSEFYTPEKWLKSRREYYPNGEFKQTFSVGYNNDTIALQIYELNEDSTIKKEIWYNKFLKKWMDGDTYYYNKGETKPYMKNNPNEINSFKWHYTYNNRKQLINRLLKDDWNENFTEFEYTYDTTGLLIQQIEYGFFDNQREEKTKHVYEYEKDNAGRVIKKQVFYVPHHTKEIVTKTDKEGNQMTTYYGFASKEKVNTETIYYNDTGEQIKKVKYDRQGIPSTIGTYEYEYYK